MIPLVDVILLLEVISADPEEPGHCPEFLTWTFPIKYLPVHWGYIARLRRSCKALSRIFYSTAEHRIWSRHPTLNFPVMPKVFVYESLTNQRRKGQVPWCDHTHRPEWERMRRAVATSVIYAKVKLRMKGSKPFQEDHLLQIYGNDGFVFRLRRQQVAFHCPPDPRSEGKNMPLCRHHIEEPQKTEENEEKKEEQVEPKNVILVNHLSFTNAGKLVVWLHDSVRMWSGNKCPNGNPIIGVGESFSAGVRIKGAWLAIHFKLTMHAGHM